MMSVHKITNRSGWTLSQFKKERNKHSAEPKAFQKLTVIYEAMKGKDVNIIADSLSLHHQTVIKYINIFNEGGLDKLLERKSSPGRPSKLTKQQKELCKEIFQSTPRAIDYGVSVNWDTKIMQSYIKDNFNVELDRSTISRMVHNLGFTFTRPTYVLAKANHDNQTAFEAGFGELKKNLNDSDVLLFEDECCIRDYQAIAATWFLRGEQRKVKTYGKHAGVGLFGVLDYNNGRVFCDTYEKLNTQNYELFLENTVLPLYEGKHIYIITDNSKIHHAKSFQEFKDKHKETITFFYLPPYSPNLNRIEGLWKWLKETVIYNNFLKDVKEIRKVVFEFLNSIKYASEAIKQRLCF